MKIILNHVDRHWFKPLLTYILSIIMVGGLVFSLPSLIPSRVKAVGNVYYVRTDGSNSNTGLSNDSAHAWLTIQKAASTVVAGDTVNVVAGTYTSTQLTFAVNGSSGNPITFQNYNGGTVNIVITGGSFDAVQIGYGNTAAYTTINGFNISAPTCNIDIDIWGNNITIKNCTCTTCLYSGIQAQSTASYITIDTCIITGTNTLPDDEMISFYGVNHYEIKNCLVYNSISIERVGIDSKNGCQNGSIHNNIVHDTEDCGIYVDAQGVTTAHIDIYDNLVYNISNNPAFGISDELGTATITDINFYNNIAYNCRQGFTTNQVGTETRQFTLINNTFYNNQNYNTPDGSSPPYNEIWVNCVHAFIGSGTIIRNNIVYSLTNGTLTVYLAESYSSYSTVLTIDYNDYYNSGGTWASGSLIGANYIIANPALTSPTSDFSLHSGSPAIDAGTNTNAPSTDYIGTIRPQNYVTDIGAYEYYSGVITPPPVGSILDPNAISIIGVKAFQNVFETGDILYFCEYNLAYATLPALSPNETYTLSLIKPDGTSVIVARGLFSYGYNIQSIYLKASEVLSIPIVWGEGDYLRISPYPAFLIPVEGVNQATKKLLSSDWISSTNVAANDASDSSFSFYIMNLFKRIETGQHVAAGTYATLGINGNPTLSVAGRGILLQAVPFIDTVLSDLFVTALTDINVNFKSSNTSTNLQTSINTQKILGNTFATEKTNIANWLGISENSAGGLVAFFIMALMFGISFYVIRDIPSAMLMTFVFSIILAGVGLIPINLMFVLVIIAATYMLFLVWRFVF